MNAYNCTICGAGLVRVANWWNGTTPKETICAECERDNNLIEVVRCKDCIFRETISAFDLCAKGVPNFEMDGYCSSGERRAK